MTLSGKSHFEANVDESHGACGEQSLGFLNPFVHYIFVRGPSGALAKQVCEMLRTHLYEFGQIF